MDPLLLLALVGIVIFILAAVPAQSPPEHIVMVVVPQERPTFGCTFLILLFLLIVVALVSAGR
jgi:hypothetical protein